MGVIPVDGRKGRPKSISKLVNEKRGKLGR